MRVHVSHSLGALREDIARARRQAPRAYRAATVDTALRAHRRLNNLAAGVDLGHPFELWTAGGELHLGVRADHPRGQEVLDHEYGSPTSPPQATFRNGQARMRAPLRERFEREFHARIYAGTRWG